MQKLSVTQKDIRLIRGLDRKERIRPVTEENLFTGALYCLLSARENYDKQVAVFNDLLSDGLSTPEEILRRKRDIRKHVKITSYPDKKRSYIIGLAEWWPKSDLPARLVADATNGRHLEFELREEIAKFAPGLGRKCASFLMVKSGYQNVVVVDRWASYYLEDCGYRVKVQREGVSGFNKSEYLRSEQLFSEEARRHKMTPADFQRLVWIRGSGWKP